MVSLPKVLEFIKVSGVSVSIKDIVPREDKADIIFYVVNGVVPRKMKIIIEALDENKVPILSKEIEESFKPLEKEEFRVSVPYETKYLRVKIEGIIRELVEKEVPVSIPTPPKAKPPSVPVTPPPVTIPKVPPPTAPPK